MKARASPADSAPTAATANEESSGRLLGLATRFRPTEGIVFSVLLEQVVRAESHGVMACVKPCNLAACALTTGDARQFFFFL